MICGTILGKTALQSIGKALHTLSMDFYCGKKHRYRGTFCKFGELIAKFDEKWGIFESHKPPNGFVDTQSRETQVLRLFLIYWLAAKDWQINAA